MLLALGLITKLNAITGLITSDGSWKSPVSDDSYKAPVSDKDYQSAKSDDDYKAPTSGPGYVAPKIDSNWKAPTSDNNWSSPTASPTNILNATKTVVQPEDQTNNIIPANNTDNKEDFLPQWKFAGKWRAITLLISYSDGEWEYLDAPTELLEIKDDHNWEMGAQKGKWRVEKIEESDWQRWQVKKYFPETKLVFDEPDGSITDGPIEPSTLWVIYDVDQQDGRGMRNVQVRFQKAIAQSDYLFTVDKVGAGLVRSLDKKIDCGPVCLKNYKAGQMVTLVATPDEGWSFSKWSGNCIGTESVCRVVVDGQTTVAAEFKGSCNDNSGCPQDQACIESNCVQLECKCGIVKEHACQKYECCYSSDCGEGRKCNVQARKCVEESGCRGIMINGDPASKHDLVFVGANFKDYETLEKAVKLLLDYEGNFESKLGAFSLSPFKENLDKFNYWMVLAPNYPHYEEDSPVKGMGADKLYYPDETYYLDFVKNCERDTIIILSPLVFRSFAGLPTQGASGGIVFLSLNNPLKEASLYHGRTLAHELGHAMGGLADEYVEYGAKEQSGDRPNCAKDIDEARRKWGDLAGIDGVDYYTGIDGVNGTKYYKSPQPSIPDLGFFPDGSDFSDGGCAFVHKNIRPTVSSIMTMHYTLDNDFGPVNERILSEKLKAYDSQPSIEPQGVRGRRFVEDPG